MNLEEKKSKALVGKHYTCGTWHSFEISIRQYIMPSFRFFRGDKEQKRQIANPFFIEHPDVKYMDLSVALSGVIKSSRKKPFHTTRNDYNWVTFYEPFPSSHSHSLDEVPFRKNWDPDYSIGFIYFGDYGKMSDWLRDELKKRTTRSKGQDNNILVYKK